MHPAARRTQGARGRLPALLFLAAATVLPQASRAEGGPKWPAVLDRVLPAHPSRLIVKLRSAASAGGDPLPARGAASAGVMDLETVAPLNDRFGVRGTRPLFFAHDAPGSPRRGAYALWLDQVRGRYPARAARARQAPAAPDLSSIYVLDLPPGTNIAAAAAAYAADPNVAYAHPDYEVRASLTPNDPFLSSAGSWGQAYPDLWGLITTQAEEAWNTATGAGVVVAVIDTGVDNTHPDLAANMWTNPGEVAGNGTDDDGNGFVDDVWGWDFDENDNVPYDRHGHGTHVAGTVAAVGNNGIGVVGMSWGARVMAVKGLGDDGRGWMSDLAEAILYAAENGADVLSNSWGGYGSDSALNDAVATAASLGCVVVAAAGNDGGSNSADYIMPASLPQVIAVGATQVGDVHASFSNRGKVLSVAAPGVDILSLRGAVSGPVGGNVVAADYLRLSGTSMATPHVAGLAAVLLSALPTLTPDEVRWHLELNADQPGYPGYEGAPWNPYFGWGRINAARVFDPPPATTRLRTGPIGLHAFAGDQSPDVAAMDFTFTTSDPVPWTLSSPAWLPPAVAAGAGPARVMLSLDARALDVGLYTGTVTLNAPATVDGGAPVPASVTLHRDQRIGGEFQVASDVSCLWSRPAAVSDGLGSAIVWAACDLASGPKLFSVRVDGGGNLTEPSVLVGADPRRTKDSPRAAFDGRNFLVAWVERDSSTAERPQEYVMAMRVAPTGEPLDAAPIVVESRRRRELAGLFGAGVAFDGEAYTVLWSEVNVRTDKTKTDIRRVGSDGTLRGKRRRVYPSPGTAWWQSVTPKIACIPGQCLVAWKEADGEVSPTGKYIDKAYGVRVQGTTVLDRAPVRLLTDADDLTEIGSDGSGYLLLAPRWNICAGPVNCGFDTVAARVTAGGVSLDPNGLLIANTPPDEVTYTSPAGVTHDGSNYVVSFYGPGLFAARLGADGTLLDDEEPYGLLLSTTRTIGGTALASTRTHAVLAWTDSRFDSDGDSFVDYNAIYAQRLLAHPPSPAFPVLAVGDIGPQAVAERAALGFTVSAPALDPDTATFSASNLPPGAVFDAATRTFRWMPESNEAGTYPGVHFEATDGVSTVGEDVTITVSEAVPSISGTVVDSGGVGVGGVAIRVSGTPGGSRTGFTDSTGAFHFDNLGPPDSFSLRLGRPSNKLYTATPRRVRVPLSVNDVRGVRFVVTPRA